MSLVIGIVGRAKVGKSLVARAIKDEAKMWKMSARIFELSDFILQELQGNGLLRGKTRAELSPEDIQLILKRGAERRKQNPDYWVDLLREELDRSPYNVCIVPNVRLKPEADLIREKRGTLVRVTSLIKDGVEWISEDRSPNDITETSVYDFPADFFLSTIKGQTILLQEQARAVFKYVLGVERAN